MQTTQKIELPFQDEINKLAEVQVQQSNHFDLPLLEQFKFLNLKYDFIRNDYYDHKKYDLVQKLDLVDMMFDIHTQLNSLPADIKDHLYLLKIIVLKCALYHSEFFVAESNPVAEYLKTISLHIEKNLTPKNELNFQQLLTKSVNALITEFQSDPAIFTLQTKKQLASFKHVNRANLKITQPIDDQTTIQCKLALKKITDNYNLSEDTHAFINMVWSKVLAHIANRTDIQSKEWTQALKVANLLAWSLSVNSAIKDKKRFLQALPILFKSLALGLKKINEYDSYFVKISQIITLEHATVIKHLFTSSINEEKNHAPQLKTNAVRSKPVRTAKCYATAEDIQAKSEIEAAKSLNKGDWLLLNQKSNSLHIKLIWKAKDSSEFIFVNKNGEKTKQCSLYELAADFENNVVSFIDDKNNPIKNTSIHAKDSSILKTIG